MMQCCSQRRPECCALPAARRLLMVMLSTAVRTAGGCLPLEANARIITGNSQTTPQKQGSTVGCGWDFQVAHISHRTKYSVIVELHEKEEYKRRLLSVLVQSL